MINYLRANTDYEYQQASLLFKEYAEWLNIDLGFQHFNDELMELKTMYGKPTGGIVLCKIKSGFTGCVGIRKIDNDTAELKRMFIKTAYQKQGTGKTLLDKAVELAKSLNYKAIRLDTLNYMTPAIKLYRQYGFYEIPAYYTNPNETALYFEKILTD
jgi:ribosomal protein S18 acetylase RimI-like enzyme